ncbi:membrane protein [Sulfolobus acidocaldarius SUSAZ]|nr:membrane protein [Sulfolobus acidocaldarius SUSAZ]
MKLVIFALLSLLFTFIDVRIGIEAMRVIYGQIVYELATSIPFLLLYSVIVYIVEFLLISSIGQITLRIIKRLKKSSN